jgi:hypothetical protein
LRSFDRSIAHPPLFDHQDLEAGLLDSVRDMNAGLVIIDTRNKSLGADQSEDSNDTAGQVNGVLSRVSAATGCTFVTTHHTGHRARARGRGASAWIQGVDFSFLVVGNAIMMASGQVMKLEPNKMRDDEWPDPVAFRLKKVEGLWVDEKHWNSAVLEGVDVHVDGRDFSPIQARVFWYVQDNPGCSGESLRRGVHGKNDEIHTEKQRLLDLGAINNLGQPNRHSYHVMPGWHVNADSEVEQAERDVPEDLAGDADQSETEGEGTDQ